MYMDLLLSLAGKGVNKTNRNDFRRSEGMIKHIRPRKYVCPYVNAIHIMLLSNLPDIGSPWPGTKSNLGE